MSLDGLCQDRVVVSIVAERTLKALDGSARGRDECHCCGLTLNQPEFGTGSFDFETPCFQSSV